MAPRKQLKKVIQLTHVRVCIGTDRCALTVYSATDDYYKMEPIAKEGNIFVRRSIESPKESKSRVEKDVKSKSVLQAMACELEDWMRRGIANSLEVELNFTDPLEVQETASRLKNLLKGPILRAEKLVFNNGTAMGFQQAIVDLCDRKYLKEIQKRIIYPDARSVYPVYVFDRFVPNYMDGLPMRCSHISMKWRYFNDLLEDIIKLIEKEEPGGYWMLRAPHQEPYKTLCPGPGQYLLQQHKNGTMERRTVIGDIVLRHKVTDCGYYLTAIRSADEDSVNWNGELCGQAEFCAERRTNSCSSTFEHDYFHDLPRRVFEDPQWCHVFFPLFDESELQEILQRLCFCVQKTSPTAIRRAEEGYEVGTVNLFSDPSTICNCCMLYFLWFNTICCITPIIIYFSPNLMSPFFLLLSLSLLPVCLVILLFLGRLIWDFITSLITK